MIDEEHENAQIYDNDNVKSGFHVIKIKKSKIQSISIINNYIYIDIETIRYIKIGDEK